MNHRPWQPPSSDHWLPQRLRLCWGDSSSDGGGEATSGGGDWGSAGTYDASSFDAGGDLGAWAGTAYDAATSGTGAGGGGDWGSFGATNYSGYNVSDPGTSLGLTANDIGLAQTGGGDWGSAGGYSTGIGGAGEAAGYGGGYGGYGGGGIGQGGYGSPGSGVGVGGGGGFGSFGAGGGGGGQAGGGRGGGSFGRFASPGEAQGFGTEAAGQGLYGETGGVVGGAPEGIGGEAAPLGGAAPPASEESVGGEAAALGGEAAPPSEAAAAVSQAISNAEQSRPSDSAVISPPAYSPDFNAAFDAFNAPSGYDTTMESGAPVSTATPDNANTLGADPSLSGGYVTSAPDFSQSFADVTSPSGMDIAGDQGMAALGWGISPGLAQALDTLSQTTQQSLAPVETLPEVTVTAPAQPGYSPDFNQAFESFTAAPGWNPAEQTAGRAGLAEPTDWAGNPLAAPTNLDPNYVPDFNQAFNENYGPTYSPNFDQAFNEDYGPSITGPGFTTFQGAPAVPTANQILVWDPESGKYLDPQQSLINSFLLGGPDIRSLNPDAIAAFEQGQQGRAGQNYIMETPFVSPTLPTQTVNVDLAPPAAETTPTAPPTETATPAPPAETMPPEQFTATPPSDIAPSAELGGVPPAGPPQTALPPAQAALPPVIHGEDYGTDPDHAVPPDGGPQDGQQNIEQNGRSTAAVAAPGQSHLNRPNPTAQERQEFTNWQLDRPGNPFYQDRGMWFPQGRPGVAWQTAEQAGVHPLFNTRDHNWRSLNAQLVERLNRAYEAMPDNIRSSFALNSAYRPATRADARSVGMSDFQSQESVYARGHAPGGRHFASARPGGSNHGHGRAVDVQPGAALNWLQAHGRQFGLTGIGRGDWPHIQMIEGRGAQQAVRGRQQTTAVQAAVPMPPSRPATAPTAQMPDIPRPPADIPPQTALPPVTAPSPPATVPPARGTPDPAMLGRTAMQIATAMAATGSRPSSMAEGQAALSSLATALGRAGIPAATASHTITEVARQGTRQAGYDPDGIAASVIAGMIAAAMRGYHVTPFAGAVQGPPQQIEARAEGGPVTKDKPYLVGEEGPEYFVPDQPGTILPYVPRATGRENFGKWPRVPSRDFPGQYIGLGGAIQNESRAAQFPTGLLDLFNTGALRLDPRNWERMLANPRLQAMGRARIEDRRNDPYY